MKWNIANSPEVPRNKHCPDFGDDSLILHNFTICVYIPKQYGFPFFNFL